LPTLPPQQAGVETAEAFLEQARTAKVLKHCTEASDTAVKAAAAAEEAAAAASTATDLWTKAAEYCCDGVADWEEVVEAAAQRPTTMAEFEGSGGRAMELATATAEMVYTNAETAGIIAAKLSSSAVVASCAATNAARNALHAMGEVVAARKATNKRKNNIHNDNDQLERNVAAKAEPRAHPPARPPTQIERAAQDDYGLNILFTTPHASSSSGRG
jgi:hypothetical protein